MFHPTKPLLFSSGDGIFYWVILDGNVKVYKGVCRGWEGEMFSGEEVVVDAEEVDEVEEW